MTWRAVLGEGRAPVLVLICLAVWLFAADSLVTATIMPSVAASLGGYAVFGWATAGFLLGAVMAAATAGLAAERYGLRRAMAGAAVLYAAGCAASAAAPDIGLFLAGRLVQGVAGGWLSGLASVAVGLVFPQLTLPRVYAATSSVWGVASLLGPLIGGIFADAGIWRMTFWFFAAQGSVAALAALHLLPDETGRAAHTGLAWRQLTLIATGIVAIAMANLAGPLAAGVLVVLGLAALIGAVRVNRTAPVRLFPRQAVDLTRSPGAAYAALFLAIGASMGFSVYGPALLQTLGGHSALTAGYVIALEAIAWSAAALMVAHLTGAWRTWMIRAGSLCIVAGLALSALAFPAASLPLVIAAGCVLGAGFGLSTSFIMQRNLGSVDAADRAVAAAGMTTARLTGSAAGAAAVAIVANLSGFDGGFTAPAAKTAGLWIFAASAPVAVLAALAAWQVDDATER